MGFGIKNVKIFKTLKLNTNLDSFHNHLGRLKSPSSPSLIKKAKKRNG